jgi:hypothetical protein
MQIAVQTQAWQCGANSWEQCANSSTPSEVDMDVDWIAVYTPAGQLAAPDHPAAVPATTSGDSSVSLAAFAALVGMGGGLFLIAERRRLRIRRTQARITAWPDR